MSRNAMAAALRELAERGCTVTMPPDVALELVDGLGSADDGEWCGIAHASEITGIPAATLRGRAPAWALATAEGRKPAIRTRKKDPSNPGSHWEFNVSDLWRNRRAPTGTDARGLRRGHLRVHDGGASGPASRDEVIDGWVKRTRRLYEGA